MKASTPTHGRSLSLSPTHSTPVLRGSRERRCTRYVAMHPIRRGVMPTDRVHRLPQQAQPRAFPPDTPKRQHQTQPHNLEIHARLQTRGATPDPSRCTRSVALHPIRRCVMPTDRVHCLIFNKRIADSLALRRPRRRPTGPGRAALHHLGSITPVREHYTASELV